MSLFDFLRLPQSAASEQTAPPAATLFDLLKRSAQQQQATVGLPSDQAQYDTPAAPSLFNANAAMPPAAPAQPAQQPSAAMPSLFTRAPITIQQAEGASPGDRLVAGLQSFSASDGWIPSLLNGFSGLATGQRTDPAGIKAAREQQAQTMSAQALIRKGVDPQTAQAAVLNPKLMDTLVAQLYGAQTVTPLGNGYVADKNGNVRRAYEPEDKTPAGFIKADDGSLRAAPGGPADPAYIKSRTEAEGGGTSVDAQVNARKAIAEKMGMKPDNPGYQSYILTGKLPREDAQPLTATDKKAILEADEKVVSTGNAIGALKEALNLSPQVHTGLFASQRARLGNILPDALVPDAIASPESSKATANYENLVLGQALSQLKSTFGAAPTEGERKILLELQASANLPVEVRKEILTRAIAIAESHRGLAQRQSDDLRGNTYYKPKKPGETSGAPITGNANGLTWSVQ